MRYNDSCSAGVAHLAERHLAKVEVASSNLVARSKTKILSRQRQDFRFVLFILNYSVFSIHYPSDRIL